MNKSETEVFVKQPLALPGSAKHQVQVCYEISYSQAQFLFRCVYRRLRQDKKDTKLTVVMWCQNFDGISASDHCRRLCTRSGILNTIFFLANCLLDSCGDHGQT